MAEDMLGKIDVNKYDYGGNFHLGILWRLHILWVTKTIVTDRLKEIKIKLIRRTRKSINIWSYCN